MAQRIPSQIWSAFWLLLLSGLAVWLRWPALGTEGFHNEDVAGITYNADLIRRGFLPLVDNLEYKAPGAFYLTAFLWSLFGRSIVALQWVAVFWSILTMLGIFSVGRLLYGARTAAVAALIYAAVSPVTDSIDINYGAWMIGPYVWATAAFLWGAKSGRLRWLIVTGMLLAVAGLLKRQAAVLFPLFALAPFLGRYVAWPEGWAGFSEPRRAVLGLFVGLAIGFAPIMIWYLSQGALGTFVSSYFFSESGWKYVQGASSLKDQILRVGDGLLGFTEYLATPTLLATVAIVCAVRAGTCWTARGLFIAGHLGLSFVGAALGLRFFKGYYLQLLPALVWIAAHPGGLITQWFSKNLWSAPKVGLRSAALVFGALLLISPAAIHDGMQVDKIRKRRTAARDPVAQKIGKLIKENTRRDERIWVWGRWAWPVYFHSDRLAATHFPKSLGVFTTNLTNTWRRPTKNTAFDPKSPWKTLIKQLKKDKPSFLILSHNESYRKFKALQRILRKDYRAARGFKTRGFSVYFRKEMTVKLPKPAFKRLKKKRRRPSKRGKKLNRPVPKKQPRFEGKKSKKLPGTELGPQGIRPRKGIPNTQGTAIPKKVRPMSKPTR